MKKFLLITAFGIGLGSAASAQSYQILNGDFEDWIADTTGKELPTGHNWTDLGFGVYKTTDAYSGSYALMLRSTDTLSFRHIGRLHNGVLSSTSSIIPGEPYVDSPKFCVIHYKYITENTDTAYFIVQMRDTIGGPISANSITSLYPTPTYEKKVIKLNYANNNINYFLIDISSSNTSSLLYNRGISELYIDSIYFTNDTSTAPTSLIELDVDNHLTVYPNPTSNLLNFNEALTGTLTVYDVVGKSVLNLDIHNSRSVDVSGLKSGIYFITITNENGIRSYTKIIKE